MEQLPPSSTQPVAVITGASSGIGRSVAQRFAAAGFYVVLVARRQDELERTLELAGGSGMCLAHDMADPAQVEAVAASILDVCGRCDVLVNNAGAGCRTPMTSDDGPDALDRLMHVNFLSAARLTNRLLPGLRTAATSPRGGLRRPAVVNVSSVAGLMGLPSASIYCSTKFALTGWSQAMHAELSSENIRVACVHPGPVPTEGWPHERIRRSWYRWFAASTTARVTNVIFDQACSRRRNPAPVVPVSYRGAVIAATFAPWGLRAILRRAKTERHMNYVGDMTPEETT